MPVQRIEKIAFRYFRGGCQPVTFEFDPKRQVVLVFGENGTGKSTLADALDFICNGEFGSIRDRSGTTPKQHIVTLNARPDDLEVQLIYGGQRWQASLKGGKPKTTPEKPPRAFILRRADITRVMEANPSERYKALQAFITVPKIEKAEAALREASKAISQDVDRAVADRTQAEGILKDLWQREGRPGGDSIGWARQQVNEDISKLKSKAAQLKGLIGQLDSISTARQSSAQAAARVVEAQTALGTAQAALANAEAVEAGARAGLVALLQDAERFLSANPDATACPVCGKPEDATLLHRRVRQQLDDLQQMRRLSEVLSTRQRELEQARGDCAGQERSYKTRILELRLKLATASPELDLARFGEKMPRALDAESDVIQAEAVVEALKRSKTAWQATADQAQRTVDQVNALSANLAAIQRGVTEMEERQAVAERLKKMLVIVEEERKTYVTGVMTEISSTVDDLLRRIHPGEAVGNPVFTMKQATAGSLEMKARFGTADGIAPTAYYSESHLDTLGLCVYLALAKHSKAGNAIVVLDDILTSVDDSHLDRIIGLIQEEAPNFGHLIITTHSRAWYDRMRIARGFDADLIELYGWDLLNGIRHSRSPLLVEELHQMLLTPRLDRQSTAAKAGVLLEQLLDELTLRYGCRMRRKRDGYTLGELKDAIDSKLGRLLKAETIDDAGDWIPVELKPLIDATTDYSWVRNQVGAHFNLAASGVPDGMVREFAERVVTLGKSLTCPACHQLPCRNKSGEYWECGGGCGRIHLRPLMPPE